MLKRCGAVLLTMTLSCGLSHARDESGKVIPDAAHQGNSTETHTPDKAQPEKISIPDSENQRLFSINTSLTVGALFQAYMDSDPDQRRLSEMYVLGVIDSSEGDAWCGYEIASPAAIQEQTYVGLQKAFADVRNERAATAIKSHLSKILPCKKDSEV